MHERYNGIPIFVTECGAAFRDPVSENGEDVQDVERLEFLREHIRAAMDAYDQGVNLRGFFVWSLLDNFEWNSGYTLPFGIVQVDFETLRRTVKSSGRFYSEVARSNGAALLTQSAGALSAASESQSTR